MIIDMIIPIVDMISDMIIPIAAILKFFSIIFFVTLQSMTLLNFMSKAHPPGHDQTKNTMGQIGLNLF